MHVAGAGRRAAKSTRAPTSSRSGPVLYRDAHRQARLPGRRPRPPPWRPSSRTSPQSCLTASVPDLPREVERVAAAVSPQGSWAAAIASMAEICVALQFERRVESGSRLWWVRERRPASSQWGRSTPRGRPMAGRFAFSRYQPRARSHGSELDVVSALGGPGRKVANRMAHGTSWGGWTPSGYSGARPGSPAAFPFGSCRR